MSPIRPQTGSHWLLDWMDEFDIFEGASVRTRGVLPGPMKRLQELALKTRPVSSVDLGRSIVVAGPGMEHGTGPCCTSRCRNAVIDNEFSQVLHYFDFVVMRGPSGAQYSADIEAISTDGQLDDFIRRLADDVSILKHMRDIGLMKYVYFVNTTSSAPQNEFRGLAKNLGLDQMVNHDQLHRVMERIRKDGGVECWQEGKDLWKVRLDHPLLGNPVILPIRQSKKPTISKVIEGHLIWLLSELVFTASFAQASKAPLATLTVPEFFERTGSTVDRSDGLSVDEVALSLKIPIFTDLGTREMIRLREQEYEHFVSFRKALVAGIRSAIEKVGDDSPDRIAQVVWRDTIEPAVAEVERKVRADNRSLIWKSVTGLTVGCATAAIGAMAAMPFIVTAGAAAAATPLVQAYKYYDDRRDIQLSEMYFLWMASKHHRR